MRKYRTPGVYFERQDTAPPLIGPLRTDIAGFVGIAERGPLHTPVKIESFAQFSNVFGRKIAQGYLAYAVDGFFMNGGQTCWVVRVADQDKAKTASLDIADDALGRKLSLRAGSPGVWGNGVFARWMMRGDEMVSLTLHFPDGTEQQVRDPLSFNLPKSVNLIELNQDALPASLLMPLVTLDMPERVAPSDNRVSINALEGWLDGGSDGLTTLTPEHFSGIDAPPDKPRGLAALERVEEVSIVVMPDMMPKLRVLPETKPSKPDCINLDAVFPPTALPQPEPEFPPAFTLDQIFLLEQEMVNHCEKVRYRFAVLDTPDVASREGLLPEGAIDWCRSLQGTNRCALYYPWILVDDPLRLTDLVRAVPPSGYVAGIYARSDRTRGVHKPPANEVVEGAVDLRFVVTDILHARLNDEGVNVLRPFAGRGIRVYGARTLDTEIRFVNVRRLLSMIEKAIDQGTQWTVFEPNSVVLRSEMDRVVRSYLQTLFRQGMLDGGTPDEAYFVKCDDSTNPPEEIDRGRVICQIGVQPPYPAEFVVALIGKTQNGIEVLQEQGGQGA